MEYVKRGKSTDRFGPECRHRPTVPRPFQDTPGTESPPISVPESPLSQSAPVPSFSSRRRSDSPRPCDDPGRDQPPSDTRHNPSPKPWTHTRSHCHGHETPSPTPLSCRGGVHTCRPNLTTTPPNRTPPGVRRDNLGFILSKNVASGPRLSADVSPPREEKGPPWGAHGEEAPPRNPSTHLGRVKGRWTPTERGDGSKLPTPTTDRPSGHRGVILPLGVDMGGLPTSAEYHGERTDKAPQAFSE